MSKLNSACVEGRARLGSTRPVSHTQTKKKPFVRANNITDDIKECYNLTVVAKEPEEEKERHHHHQHHHHHLSLYCEGRWGTTDDFTASFLHFSLFSTALWDMANFRPVHSPMLSSHLFFCLPCLLPPFTVPCKVVLARPGKWETCPYHFSFASLYNGQEVFVWSTYLLDLSSDFLVGNMVFV